MPHEAVTYYIAGFFRQGNAALARAYLGISDSAAGGISQLTGDITAGPGTGSQVATISNSSVTYTKMQNVSASPRLLGRGTAGAGIVEEILLGTNLSMAGTTLNATGGSGGSPGSPDNSSQYRVDATTFGGVPLNATATNKFLRQVSSGVPSMEQVLDTDLSITPAISTNDATTTAHGFLKILNNNESNFMDGTGNWSNPTGGMAVGWFRFDSSTTVADPGAGDFRLNAGSWGATTILVFDQFSDPGNDVTAMIMLMRQNDQILIQKKNDSTIFGRFTVTATPTNQTGWFTVPVSNVVDSGTIPSNTQLCAVVVSYDGGGGSGGITDLTGDVTATGPGSAAATIANDAVTYAKMQNVSAASRLIGRGSAGGSGNPEEISVGSGLTMSGTTLLSTAGGNWEEFVEAAILCGGAAAAFAFSCNINQNAAPTEVNVSTSNLQALLYSTTDTDESLCFIATDASTGSFMYGYKSEASFWVTPLQNTGGRFFFGVTTSSDTAQTASDLPSGNYAGFRYVAGTDTNWRLISGDANNTNSTENLDSTVAVSITTMVRLTIKWDGSAANGFDFYIDGTYVGSTTLNPDEDTAFRLACIGRNTVGGAGTARSFRFAGEKIRVFYPS